MKYYLHDTNSRNDEKITLIFIKYGYEGVGLFYCILEVLAAQEKPISENVLKAQLGIRKKLEKVLRFMYEIEILSIKNGEVFNENILNFSEKYQIKKEKDRKKIAEWRERQKDTKNVTGYESVRNDPKAKESKAKESKIDITAQSKIFYDSLIPFLKTYSKETIKDFYDYWTEPNKSKTKLKFELERTWDLSRRLSRWNKNDFNKSNKSDSIKDTIYQDFNIK